MSRIKWLERGGIQIPYLTLCLDEKAFFAAMIHAKVDRPWLDFMSKGADATTHSIFDDDGPTICVVCIPRDAHRNNIEDIVGLLAHEAVHVMASMREGCPSLPFADEEFEAQIVSHITRVLFEDWIRQTGRARVLPRKRAKKGAK